MSKNRVSFVCDQTNFQESASKTLFNLSDFNNKSVEVCFNAEQTSSDGALLLLKEIEKDIGLISKMADCIYDSRHQGYVDHSIPSMIMQRVMQIAAGYEDANDCNTLRGDGILKIYSGSKQHLASPPNWHKS